MNRSTINLYQGDSLKAMKQMPDKAYQLAIVDPPYGINITNSDRLAKYNKNNNKWDKTIPNKEYFDELFRISENQIIWGGNYFSLPPTRGYIIWDKKQPEKLSFAMSEFAWSSFDVSAKTFYKSPIGDKDRFHPTQKPVELYKWLLQNYAKEGDKILDTHGGSFSLAIACWDLKFDLDAWEIDEDYYKAGKKRFELHKKQLFLL